MLDGFGRYIKIDTEGTILCYIGNWKVGTAHGFGHRKIHEVWNKPHQPEFRPFQVMKNLTE